MQIIARGVPLAFTVSASALYIELLAEIGSIQAAKTTIFAPAESWDKTVVGKSRIVQAMRGNDSKRRQRKQDNAETVRLPST